ncbi:WD40 repeat domain-containing protein, partial [Streptomyces sp. NPDC001966]
TGHTDAVVAVATGVMDGRPIAVTSSLDETVRVWDLTTGQQVGEPLTGHTDDVRAVATGVADGRPIAVTGSDDGTVRVWDLTTHRQTGPALTFPAPIEAVAVTPHNTHLTVVFGHDIAALSPH